MNIVGKKYWWFGLSGILIVPGVIALLLWGLKLGIDFKGGSIAEYSFTNQVQTSEVKSTLDELKIEGLSVQSFGDKGMLIRLPDINEETHQKLKEAVNKKWPDATESRFESVGPTVSKDLTKKAFLSVIIASLGIIFYLAYAFRRVPKPASSWRFGICAVAALIHDVLFVTGVFAILGHFAGIEVDGMFVTALLTVIGFSVHDTIVVFDRIRENMITRKFGSFEETANFSILQTLARSINTSLTVIITLLALYIFGGTSIKTFVLALLIGITVGTYSSIFNATPLLVVWQEWSQKRKMAK